MCSAWVTPMKFGWCNGSWEGWNPVCEGRADWNPISPVWQSWRGRRAWNGERGKKVRSSGSVFRRWVSFMRVCPLPSSKSRASWEPIEESLLDTVTQQPREEKKAKQISWAQAKQPLGLDPGTNLSHLVTLSPEQLSLISPFHQLSLTEGPG